MSINFSTKNVKFPGALKAYTEIQLQSLEKIAGNIIDADIIINQEKIEHKVEITVKTRLSIFHGEGRDRILKQALRKALGAVKTQAKKLKGKIKEEKKRPGGKPSAEGLGHLVPFPGKAKRPAKTAKTQEGKERVILSENYSRKPVSVEEAIFFLKESGENCYMFIDTDSNRMAALFINQQGALVLIEPDM